MEIQKDSAQVDSKVDLDSNHNKINESLNHILDEKMRLEIPDTSKSQRNENH